LVRKEKVTEIRFFLVLSFFRFFRALDKFGDWQDISQPKSEANPPDGVLAVPLLRHQVCLVVSVV